MRKDKIYKNKFNNISVRLVHQTTKHFCEKLNNLIKWRGITYSWIRRLNILR